MNTIIKNMISDIKVELLDEFDRNFQRKGFFNDPWPQTKMNVKRGSLMMRTGQLRRGNRATISGTNIIFTNSQPYAGLHNSGGTIIVTVRMIKFFWAMYYKTAEAAAKNGGKRKIVLTGEAGMWKALALKKPGTVIKIPKRQFIGWHPQLQPRIENIVNHHFRDIEHFITQKLKP